MATAPGINRVRESPQVFWPQPAWLDALQAEETVGRIDSRLMFWSNVGEIYGLADIRGISPLKYEKLAQLEKLPLPARWALLNVTHALQPNPEPGVVMTAVAPITRSIVPGEERQATLYRLDNPQPYARMAYDVTTVPDDDAAFAALRAPDFDLTQDAVITGAMIEAAPPDAPPAVAVQARRSGFAELTVTTASPGVLLLSEWDLPGWQVQVDGAAADPLTVNYALQGVWLPAGTHTVTWRYRPWQVPLGISLSLLTLLGTAVLLLRSRTLPVGERRPSRQPRLGHAPSFASLAKSVQSIKSVSRSTQWRAYLLLLTLAAWGVRVFSAASQELRGDEGFSYMFASMPLREIVPALLPAGDPHSPFHYLLLHGMMQLGGDSELAMRLPALACGVLLIPLMAEWGRLVAGRRVGALAALLTAVSHTLIWLSQDVRSQYAIALSATVLSNIWLMHACRRRRAGRWWAAYALTAALAVHGHLYAVFALLAHGVYVWFQPQRWRQLRRWALAGAAAALLFLPWLWVNWSQLASQHLSQALHPELARHLLAVGESLVVGDPFPSRWRRWVLLAAVGLLGVGWMWAFRRRRAWAWTLAVWLGSTTWIIYLLRFRRDIFNDFYMAVIAPGWWLLAAMGIVALWRRRTALALGGMAVLLTASVVSNGRYYALPERFQRYIGYRDVASQITADPQPGDVLLLHAPDPVWGYYLRDADVVRERLPRDYGLTDVEIEAEVAALTTAAGRIWFVPVTDNGIDPSAAVPRWLDYHLLQEADLTLRKLRLQAYRPAHTVDAVIAPLQKPLHDWLTLTGFYVMVNGQSLREETAVAPNDTVTVTLIWDAQRPVPTDYTVFVHLLGADGRLLTQHDSMPLAGTRPTTSWQVGERLIDRYTLTIPADAPPQTAQLVVGLYDPVTLERQPFAEGETAVPLTSVVLSGN